MLKVALSCEEVGEKKSAMFAFFFLTSHVELSDALNLCTFITTQNFNFESLMGTYDLFTLHVPRKELARTHFQ